MGSDWSVCQNLNTCVAFWMNQVEMRQCVVGRWQVGGGMQVLLGLWLMPGVCSLSVLVLHESLFLPIFIYDCETNMEGEVEV